MRTLIILLALAALTTPLVAGIVERPVEYADGDTALRGYVYFDDAIEGPRPGVLVVHEWWGCNDYARLRARQLAAMGYVAFAADMYGPGRTTTEAEQAQAWATPFYQDPPAWRQRAAAAWAVLANHEKTTDQPLAAIGFCFGGSTVLQLAATNPARLAGVVSFHGSPITLLDHDPDPILPQMLICHGADDPLVEPAQLHAMIDRLRQHHATVTLIEYPGAKHSFTNPAADGSFNPGVLYHEQAAADAWLDMQDFFQILFPAAP